MDPRPANAQSTCRTIDLKRERDVLAFHSALRDVPTVEDLGLDPNSHIIPSDYVRRPGVDSSLAAFCQLAAMRLQAARGLISLIDTKYQYIIAESTTRTSLRVDSPLNKANDLQFGCLRLPRRWGVCEKVLDSAALAEGHDGIIVINDLSQVEEYAHRSYVQNGPIKFYAGVPLISTTGSIVGAVCIFDDKARDALPEDDIVYLKDLAITVMEYLDVYDIKDKYRRGAEGLNGLMTFAEDATSLKPLEKYYGDSDGTFTDSTTSAIEAQGSSDRAGSDKTTAQEGSVSPARQGPSRPGSVGDFQDSLLHVSTQRLFSRAAELMCSCNDMDGVSFLDASLFTKGCFGTDPTNDEKLCQILGFATKQLSSMQGHTLPTSMTPCESSFRWVLEQYPNGYSIDCEAELWDSPIEPEDRNDAIPSNEKLEKASKDVPQHTARLKALIPNIKSALFLPLWDFDQDRWYAGCFCWSTRKERILDGKLDLPFLKTFGHSIMREVARLDASTTKQAKTTFLSSLSHELRTPLHGVLGSSHLLRNSNLDSFQASMVNSITVCGRTLLETVEHLLDHAERRDSPKNYLSKVVSHDDGLSIICEPLNTSWSAFQGHASCNVGLVTEEVVETMIIGESPFNVALDSHIAVDSLDGQISRQAIARKRSRFLILDIGDFEGFGFRLAASSYGRILINLLGNALKFTQSGYIHVSLDTEYIDDKKSAVVLRVEDTGIGMSKSFLQRAFEPFKKQNQHTSGTGVGLSVVKRILEDIGGQIDIRSEPSQGTDITMKLQLERLTEMEDHDLHINPLPLGTKGLKGRRICILYDDSEQPGSPEHENHLRLMARYVGVLTKTLNKVLKLDVYHKTHWHGSDDAEVVVCPEVSFASLESVRSAAAAANRKCPAVILIAMDVVEAETLRNDVRVTSKASVVESVTQPCGPLKLSMVLKACLESYDASDQKQSSSDTLPTEQGTLAITTESNDKTMAPRLALYPPSLAIRTRSHPTFEDLASPIVEAQTPKQSIVNDTDKSPLNVQQALIVDDNAINRRLLSAWLKRHKIPFKEAKDGQEALDKFKESNGTFDVILMDISMPIMDGMTATRLIREYETENSLKPAHILALTGLTSASAKLEAWTSGVDDFLTKPVDFKKMEALMESGRGGERSGFWDEHGTARRREDV